MTSSHPYQPPTLLLSCSDTNHSRAAVSELALQVLANGSRRRGSFGRRQWRGPSRGGAGYRVCSGTAVCLLSRSDRCLANRRGTHDLRGTPPACPAGPRGEGKRRPGWGILGRSASASQCGPFDDVGWLDHLRVRNRLAYRSVYIASHVLSVRHFAEGLIAGFCRGRTESWLRMH